MSAANEAIERLLESAETELEKGNVEVADALSRLADRWLAYRAS